MKKAHQTNLPIADSTDVGTPAAANQLVQYDANGLISAEALPAPAGGDIGTPAAAGTPVVYDANGEVPAAAIPAEFLKTIAESIASPGYLKLANGLIIQWGQTGAISDGAVVSFPIAFPTALYAVVATQDRQGAGSGQGDWGIDGRSTTGFTIDATVTGRTYGWIAIGS